MKILIWPNEIFDFEVLWTRVEKVSDNQISKASFLVTIVGYAIFYSDQISTQMTFSNLVGNQNELFWILPDLKLQIIFYGFWSLAIGNFIYRLGSPEEFKRFSTTSLDAYLSKKLNNLGPLDILEVEDILSRAEDSGWLNSETQSVRNIKVDIKEFNFRMTQSGDLSGHWDRESKRQLGTINSAIRLSHEYLNQTKQNYRVSSFVFSVTGWTLLVIPNLDLLQAVTQKVLS